MRFRSDAQRRAVFARMRKMRRDADYFSEHYDPVESTVDYRRRLSQFNEDLRKYADRSKNIYRFVGGDEGMLKGALTDMSLKIGEDSGYGGRLSLTLNPELYPFGDRGAIRLGFEKKKLAEEKPLNLVRYLPKVLFEKVDEKSAYLAPEMELTVKGDIDLGQALKEIRFGLRPDELESFIEMNPMIEREYKDIKKEFGGKVIPSEEIYIVEPSDVDILPSTRRDMKRVGVGDVRYLYSDLYSVREITKNLGKSEEEVLEELSGYLPYEFDEKGIGWEWRDGVPVPFSEKRMNEIKLKFRGGE